MFYMISIIVCQLYKFYHKKNKSKVNDPESSNLNSVLEQARK